MEPDALLIVRNSFRHDARVLRAARTLRDAGHTPEVVAILTGPGQPERSEIDGIPVVRLGRARALAWVERRFAAEASTARPATAAPSAPRASTPGRRAAVHALRLARSLDYHARAIPYTVRRRPAIVHCNDQDTMWVGVAAKALTGSRLVYDAHELWADRNGRWEWRPGLLAAEAVFTRIADQVIAASPGYADRMRRRYRIPAPTVIHNVPDVPEVPRPFPDDDARPLAVYVGGLLSGRGLEQAIDAVALVPGLRLRLIGPGGPATVAGLWQHARAVGIADRFEVADPVPSDRVIDALAGATLGLSLFQPICLSYELTMPNKLLEYVAAGLPVVTSDVPVCAAFVREHGIGEVVPARDPAGIAEGIRRLLEPRRAAEVRYRVRVAAKQFNWTNERQVLRGVYAAATR